MRKKSFVLLALIFVLGLSSVYAAETVQFESFGKINLFLNGKMDEQNAYEINGKLYVPAELLDRTNAKRFYSADFNRMDVYFDEFLNPGSESADNDKDNDYESGGVVPPNPYERSGEYHAGMIEGDLNNILKLLEDLEDLSVDFRTIIYSHLKNIPNGMDIGHAYRRLNQLQTNYNYLAERYEEMIEEMEDLVGNDHDVDDLEDDFEDDMEEIFEDKEEALENLAKWIGDKDDDDFDDYEDHDRDANEKIEDVINYVEGAQEEVRQQVDDLID